MKGYVYYKSKGLIYILVFPKFISCADSSLSFRPDDKQPIFHLNISNSRCPKLNLSFPILQRGPSWSFLISVNGRQLHSFLKTRNYDFYLSVTFIFSLSQVLMILSPKYIYICLLLSNSIATILVQTNIFS